MIESDSVETQFIARLHPSFNQVFASMLKNLLCSICILHLALLLPACAWTKKTHPAAYPDIAEVKLAEAATSVSHSLQQLAAIEMATHPTAKLPTPPNPGQIGMAQLVSVDWTGPCEPLLKKMAKISRYRLRVLGVRPAIPAIVSVSVKDTLLADVLRNIQLQIEKKARIKLYTSSRIIELRYLKN